MYNDNRDPALPLFYMTTARGRFSVILLTQNKVACTKQHRQAKSTSRRE